MKIFINIDKESGKINCLDSVKLPSNIEIEVEDGFDEMTIFDYKCVDEKLVELTPEEKEEFYPVLPSEPTDQDKVNAMLMKEIASLKSKVGGMNV